MKAAALLTPLLVLGLLIPMHKLEVWAQRPDVAARRPRRRRRVMTTPPTPRSEVAPEVPLLRDPPPPPGYVEPLAGSSVDDLFGSGAPPAQPAEPPPDNSTENSRDQ